MDGSWGVGSGEEFLIAICIGPVLNMYWESSGFGLIFFILGGL